MGDLRGFLRRLLHPGKKMGGVFAPVYLSPQLTRGFTLLSNVIANAALNSGQPIVPLDGFNGAIEIEIRNDAGAGTATVTINGSLDGVHWYPVALAPIDGQATLTYVASVAVTAAPFAHVYAVRDYWEYYQAVVTAVTGAVQLNASGVAVPMS